MKTITIKIPQWSDFTKWFWDKFCYPRRKEVAEWLELYDYNTKELFADLFADYAHLDLNKEEDVETLNHYVALWADTMKERQAKVIELIMKR